MEPIFVNKQLFTLTAPLGSRLLPHGLFVRFSAAAGIVLAAGSMEMGPDPARRSTCCIRITVTCSRSADSPPWRPRCFSSRCTAIICASAAMKVMSRRCRSEKWYGAFRSGKTVLT